MNKKMRVLLVLLILLIIFGVFGRFVPTQKLPTISIPNLHTSEILEKIRALGRNFWGNDLDEQRVITATRVPFRHQLVTLLLISANVAFAVFSIVKRNPMNSSIIIGGAIIFLSANDKLVWILFHKTNQNPIPLTFIILFLVTVVFRKIISKAVEDKSILLTLVLFGILFGVSYIGQKIILTILSPGWLSKEAEIIATSIIIWALCRCLTKGLKGADFTPLGIIFLNLGGTAILQGNLGVLEALLNHIFPGLIPPGTKNWYPLWQTVLLFIKNNPEVRFSVIGYILLFLAIVIFIAEVYREGKVLRSVAIWVLCLGIGIGGWLLKGGDWHTYLYATYLLNLVGGFFLTDWEELKQTFTSFDISALERPGDQLNGYICWLLIISSAI